MFKEIVVIVLIGTLVNLTIACTKNAKVYIKDVKPTEERIIAASLKSGEVIKFDKYGGLYIREANTITGFAVKTEQVDYEGKLTERESLTKVTLSVDSVVQVWVKRSDLVASIFTTIGVAAGVLLVVGLIAVALKESCPFIYSWDGSKWVFDAEPLGGAICRGLQRTEVSRLEYVKPEDNKYLLKLRNEVEETQYLDEIKLLVVDHHVDKVIVPDTSGRLHLVSSATSPVLAVDEHGRDISRFVELADQLAWQTQLSETELLANDDTRHHLTFEFEKPLGARKARLIVNAGTGIWGSNMIREMLQMRGEGVDLWYKSINNRGPEMLDLLHFNLREELYVMHLYLQRGNEEIQRGMIFGGGPFATDNRIVELDVSDIPGDKLVIKMNPPKSFWTLDYLAIEYDDATTITPIEVPISTGRTSFGDDISEQLHSVDGNYYVMPRIGDWSEISFEVPPPPDDRSLTRSVFLSTTGYYEIQIDKSQPERKELITKLMSEEGSISSYSIERFLEWRKAER